MPGCEPLLSADASQSMKLCPDNLFSRKWKSFQTWKLVAVINHKSFVWRGKYYGNYIQCTFFSFIHCYIVLFGVGKIKTIITVSLQKTHSMASHIYFMHLHSLSLGANSVWDFYFRNTVKRLKNSTWRFPYKLEHSNYSKS